MHSRYSIPLFFSFIGGAGIIAVYSSPSLLSNIQDKIKPFYLSMTEALVCLVPKSPPTLNDLEKIITPLFTFLSGIGIGLGFRRPHKLRDLNKAFLELPPIVTFIGGIGINVALTKTQLSLDLTNKAPQLLSGTIFGILFYDYLILEEFKDGLRKLKQISYLSHYFKDVSIGHTIPDLTIFLADFLLCNKISTETVNLAYDLALSKHVVNFNPYHCALLVCTALFVHSVRNLTSYNFGHGFEEYIDNEQLSLPLILKERSIISKIFVGPDNSFTDYICSRRAELFGKDYNQRWW